MCLSTGGAWSGGGLVPGGVCLVWGVPGPGEVVSQHALRQVPHPGETATAADGTHPTGMHSCCDCDCDSYPLHRKELQLQSHNKLQVCMNH